MVAETGQPGRPRAWYTTTVTGVSTRGPVGKQQAQVHEIHSSGSWVSRCNRKPTTNGTINVKYSKTGACHWQCSTTPVQLHQCLVIARSQNTAGVKCQHEDSGSAAAKRGRSTTGPHTSVDQTDSKERVRRRTSAGLQAQRLGQRSEPNSADATTQTASRMVCEARHAPTQKHLTPWKGWTRHQCVTPARR